MKVLARVTDVKCPICFAKPGQMCMNKRPFVSGRVHTVPAHDERRDVFNRERQAQTEQTTLEVGPLEILQLANQDVEDILQFAQDIEDGKR